MLFDSKKFNRLTDIPIEYIMPNINQPRKIFDKDELNALAKSISQNGILQPLTVRKLSCVEYELISGERRLRAADIAGMKKIPCIVMDCSDGQSAVFALIENIQRSDLNMFEEAQAIKTLISQYRLTQHQIAKRIGKSQPYVSEKLRLLNFSEEQRKSITEHGISENQVRELLKLKTEDREHMLEKIIIDSLDEAQTKRSVYNILNGIEVKQHKNQTQRFIIKDVRIFLNTFTKAFNTMKSSGINAVSNKTENDEYIEYSVKIPKSSAYKK